MKAQVLYDIGEISYTDVDKPVPGENEALVKVRACGICGSDIPRIYKTGAHNMPLIPGHEFSGVVEECASQPDLVDKRVGIFPLKPCMECPQCQSRHYEMCENYDYLGSRCDGGFADYVVVPVWNLILIPDEVTDNEAAMLEPMCVAVHAMRKAGLGLRAMCFEGNADVKEQLLPESCTGAKEQSPSGLHTGAKEQSPSGLHTGAKEQLLPGSCTGAEEQLPSGQRDDANKSIVICGLGTIGLLLAMFLKDAGYKNVLCIYNKDIQRVMLLEMGYSADNLWDYRTGDPAGFIRERTTRHAFTGAAQSHSLSDGASASAIPSRNSRDGASATSIPSRNSGDGSNATSIQNKTPGADVYFECIGTSEAYERAVSFAAPLGTVVLVGNPASDMSLKREVYWKILRNQLKLVGTWNSSFYGNPFDDKRANNRAYTKATSATNNEDCDSAHAEDSLAASPTTTGIDDWNYVLSRLPKIRKSGFSPENLITHRFTLDEMQKGLEIMRDKSEEYIKIMVGEN